MDIVNTPKPKISKKKILFILLGIILAYFILSALIFRLRFGDSYDLKYKAIQTGDLKLCDNIPSWFTRTCTSGGWFETTTLCNIKKECRNQVRYEIDVYASDEDMEVYRLSLEKDDPLLCLTMEDYSGNGIGDCLGKHMERHSDSGMCKELNPEKGRSYNGCMSKFVIRGLAEDDFCEKYTESNNKNECYFDLLKVYIFTLDKPGYSMPTHNIRTGETIDYTQIMTNINIPDICDDLEKSVDYCDGKYRSYLDFLEDMK